MLLFVQVYKILSIMTINRQWLNKLSILIYFAPFTEANLSDKTVEQSRTKESLQRSRIPLSNGDFDDIRDENLIKKECKQILPHLRACQR
jgi:hypothetical protein